MHITAEREESMDRHGNKLSHSGTKADIVANIPEDYSYNQNLSTVNDSVRVLPSSSKQFASSILSSVVKSDHLNQREERFGKLGGGRVSKIKASFNINAVCPRWPAVCSGIKPI
ncbi:hypothetical protein BDP27DRAFT_144290 [Rhodocollybia butyracea]|uniref:Uncharacterized protein n=1 Tax=Rhodocollybia butyracea TaxID=206335 RepID=A0A9P5Q407_9AGAR|nr:hypothetical protein BDP27DRAFT_144290 [Rhodocollybia butyracea]